MLARAHACIWDCGLYVYFPRSLLRAGREGVGGGVEGTRPADNDVSPARSVTLKGTAHDGDPRGRTEDDFKLFVVPFKISC